VGAILAASRAASYHVGKVVATALLTGQLGSTSPNGSVSEMVSVGEDGTLRCFDCATRAMLAAIELGGEPSAVAASGALGLVAAATADGVLRVYARRPEAEPPETPSEGGGLTLVLRARLSHASITQLAFDPSGEYLVAAAADSRLVFYGCSGREGMALLGAASLTAPPASLCWFADESGAAGPPRLLVACVDGTMLRMAPPPVAASAPEDLELTPQILQRAALRIDSTAIAIAPVPAGLALNRTGGLSFFAACADGALRAYQFNDGCRDAAEPAKLQPAPADATWEHHSKAATALATSADGLYVATGGADGVVVVRSLSGADEQATLRMHDSVSGGVAGLCLAHVAARSASGPGGLALQLLSAGRDGVLYVSSVVTPYSTEGAPVVPPQLRAVSWPAAEDVAASGAEGGDDDEPTVLEAPAAGATAVAAGGMQSAATQALQQQREQLRERLLGLLATNAAMEEGDPEKLEPERFIIDQEQQAAWRKDGDARVATLRAETDKDNLGKELLTDRYRLEFWESMATKATTLHALACPGAEVPGGPGRAQLSNFTLAEPSPEQTSLLRKVRALRRAEQLVARFELDGRPGPRMAAAGFEAPASFGAAIGTAAAEAAPVEAKPEDAKKKKKGKKDEEAAEEAEAEEEGEGAGGGAAASADTGLFYRFFELHPQWRKATQAVLHEEQTGAIKASFNEQFKSVLALKRAEIERVTEKKLRVTEVVAELKKLRMWQEELDKPIDAIGVHREEEPEKVLQVADSEIKAPKYVSAAEREKQARLAAEAAEREGANADNVGVRGLKAMMDGSLEIAVEEEEVMLEIARPEWMDTIPAAEMSEDEKAQVKEFDERVKKHEAEREKRSKGLQTELAKLHQEIVDICKGFNERLAALCDTKTRYEQAVYENELLAIKLAQARLRKELFEQKEAELEATLEQRKEGQLGTAARLGDFKREVELVREAHEALTAEDRSLDRSFRRDFADVPDFLDVLVRLYKRRKASSVVKAAPAQPGIDPEAKPAAKASKGLGAGNALLAAGAAAARDGSASADEPGRDAGPTRDPFTALDAPEMTQVIDPLDPAADMPEGLNFDVWDRLVEARGAKIQIEADLKASAEQLSEMALFLDALGAADDEARNECDALAEELQARRDAELSETWNLELPFKLKQGQLEVEEAAVVTDYSEAAFIHRGTVKSLNVEIKKLGGEKVDLLKEVRDFRRGITQLQWENTRSDMEADDLTERVRDLQLLRVTKDLQGKMKGGADEKQQQEVVQLERKIDQLKGTHEERTAELKRQVLAINRLATDKETEMENLSEQIEQLEGSVLEREMIHEIQSKNKDAAGDAHKRFSEVHMKRKLQTLVGMQTQEIELLREELDRLRRRTFPTFTHYEQARAL